MYVARVEEGVLKARPLGRSRCRWVDNNMADNDNIPGGTLLYLREGNVFSFSVSASYLGIDLPSQPPRFTL